MKTREEILEVLAVAGRVDAHVHTHLCDGKEDMTVEEKIKILNKAVYLCCKYTVENLNEKGLAVNSRTLLTKSAFARFF